MPTDPNEPPPRFWTSGILLGLGLTGVLMVLAVYRVSERRIVQEAPLENAVGEIQASLANAHLLLEDQLALADSPDLAEFWKLLDRVENLSNALLFGGEVRAGPVIRNPLTDPKLRKEVERLQALLVDYRKEARRRIGTQRTAETEPLADADYDHSFEELLAAATQVEETVSLSLSASKRRARYLATILMAAWILLVSLAVYWIQAREAQQRATAAELRRSEKKLSATLHNLAEGVISTDRESRITYANRSAEDLLESSLERLVGQPLEAVFQPVDARTGEPWRFSVQHLEDSSGPFEAADLELDTGDGSPVAIEVTVSRLDDERGSGGVVLAFRDVTQRRLAEATLMQKEAQLRQAQKMDAIGRLAGGLAHDINNYLATITTQIELLERDALSNPRQGRRTEAIVDAVSKASSLIRRLLAFSRQQPLLLQTIDLNSVTREMTAMLERLVGEDVELELDLDRQPALVKADVSQIEQILANLVLNSREAMPEGGKITVGTQLVSLEREELAGSLAAEPGRFVLLQVQDQGQGITAEHLDKICEPFFSTKRKDGNSGLGLATVYGIVQQNKGALKIESHPGRGTTVAVYLPELSRMSEVGSPSAPKPRETASPHTLLVEDDLALKDSLTELLTEMGHRVEGVASIGSAETIFEGATFDMLVTDIALPDGDGTDLARKCRESLPHLPILLISGRVPPDEAIRAPLRSGVRFLAKPFALEQFRSTIDELLTADQEPPTPARRRRGDSSESSQDRIS